MEKMQKKKKLRGILVMAFFRMLFGTYMSGMHLTYCLNASQLLYVSLFFFLARDAFWKLFSCSCRPVEYLWEFQSIPLIMYLSLECFVRNHNSPHILRFINSQAIAGKFRVTATWVEPCWKAARLWAFLDGKVFVFIPMPKFLLLSNLKILSGD